MPQELSGTVTDKDGNILSEAIQRKDGNTNASFSKAANESAEIRSDRQESVQGCVEEGEFASRLVDSYNELRGTDYRVEPKSEEDSQYADRVFVSDADTPTRITIQIRHLDPELIAKLGRSGSATVTRSTICLANLIRDAINSKSLVDKNTKAKTILQLIVPAPMGKATPEAIRETSFDFRGFREVWISPFREPSFPLTSSQDDHIKNG